MHDEVGWLLCGCEIDELTTELDPTPVKVTWQIVVKATSSLSLIAEPLIFYLTCVSCVHCGIMLQITQK